MKYAEMDWGTMEAVVNKLGGMDGVKRFLRSQVEIVYKSVLTLLTTIEIPALPQFIAKDHFRVDTSDSAEVKIAFLWDAFQNNFLGKVEEETKATTLAVHKLEKNLLDKEVFSELGEDKEETTLSQFWFLLKKQGHGQKGDLLTNGYANIFYIRDVKGELWAVNASWDAAYGGWSVYALSVAHPGRWGAGRQVVSRN